MRRFLRPIAVATICCHAVLAQDSELLDRCMEKANTQSAINDCAREEARRVDAELNAVYQRLLVAARGEPGAVDAIIAAEKVWIDYRDAYMNAMYPAKDKQAAYGSIFPTDANLVHAKLTRQQTDALRELLKHYSQSN